MLAEPDRFLPHIHAWLSALSRQEWGVAIALLDEPNSYRIVWSEREIRAAINDFFPASCWEMTDPQDMSTPARVNAGEFPDGSGYWVACSIAIHGRWSDLTAQFEFIRRPHGYDRILQDIHVL